MKKQILSIVMMIVLILSALPAVYAEGNEMSPEFEAVLNEEGKLEIKGVAPESIEEFGNLFTATFGGMSNFGFSESGLAADFSSLELMYWGESGMESHPVEVIYTYDAELAALIREETASLSAALAENRQFSLQDLELLNFWVSGSDNTSKFCGSFKGMIGYTNYDVELINTAGMSDEFTTDRSGVLTLSVDDTVYYSCFGIDFLGHHILYVPSDTAEEDLMSAAQARINAYLGDETTAVLFDRGENPEQEYIAEEWGITAEKWFGISINGEEREFGLLIVADSAKMYTPTYQSKDLLTGVEVFSDVSEIPLDTNISVEHLSEGAEYERISAALEAEYFESFDIELYSDAMGECVRKLEDGSVTVSIPVSDALSGKELVAHYVDEDGKVSDHEVTVFEGIATFTTDHFSVYSLAEKAAVNLGDTNGDGAVSLADLVRLMRYLGGKISADAIDLAAANLNGDAQIDTSDATLLCRNYLF